MPRRLQNLAFAAGLVVLVGALAAAVLIQGGHDSGDSGRTTVRASIGSGGGRAVPPSFVGVSFEYFDMHALVGIPASGPNRAVAGLLAGLDTAGGHASLRAGGGSADATWWNPSRRPKLFGIAFDFDRPLLAGLDAFERLTATPLLLALNLAQRDPAVAADLARATQRGLPRGAVVAYELGNEPDYYPLRPLVTGNPARTRPPGYSWEDYLREFGRTAARLPRGAPAAGPGLSGASGWTARLPEFLRAERRVVRQVTLHGYPLSACASDRGTSRQATVERLLDERTSAGFAGSYAPAVAAAGRAGLPLRLSEIGPVACGGTRGVSDAFASALWGVDTLFELARAGVAAVNVHGGNQQSLYTPFWTAYTGRRALASARPLYYGMLLFARAAPRGSRLVPVTARVPQGLKLWATRDGRGTVRVVAIGKDSARRWDVEVRVPGGRGRGTLERLDAPGGLAARTGIGLGGQSVPERSRDGRLRGRRVTEAVAPGGGGYRFRLDGGSAALLTVP